MKARLGRNASVTSENTIVEVRILFSYLHQHHMSPIFTHTHTHTHSLTHIHTHIYICTQTHVDSAGPLSPRAISTLREQIEKERAQLMSKKDLAEGERNIAHQELKRREDELKKAQDQHTQLEKKLQDLLSKVSRKKSQFLIIHR